MSGPSIDDLVAKLPETESAGAAATEVSASPTLTDKDRSLIGRYVIVLYCGVIAGSLSIPFIRGALVNASDLSQALDLIKTAVVPIVTLVLGYYFGKSERTP